VTDDEKCEAFREELKVLAAKYGAALGVDVYEWAHVRIGIASLDLFDNEGRWDGDVEAQDRAATASARVKAEGDALAAAMFDPNRPAVVATDPTATVFVDCYCRKCSGEDRFVTLVPPGVENAIAGDSDLNPGVPLATEFGFLRCPRGHVAPTDEGVIGGDPGERVRTDLPLGTWALRAFPG
jgi:hypothetical protein